MPTAKAAKKPATKSAAKKEPKPQPMPEAKKPTAATFAADLAERGLPADPEPIVSPGDLSPKDIATLPPQARQDDLPVIAAGSLRTCGSCGLARARHLTKCPLCATVKRLASLTDMVVRVARLLRERAEIEARLQERAP